MVYQIGGHEMPQFKVGDRVYCPDDGTGVYVVESSTYAANPILVNGERLTADGRVIKTRNVPVIFHATPENQSKLEALYGVKFDDAPKPVPVGSDLTRWLLKKHGKPVLCYVDDTSDEGAVFDAAIWVIERLSDDGCFVSRNGNYWRYAVPINATEFTTAADYVAD